MSKHHKLSKVNYRKIWEAVNGKIPPGHHIHHIDGNPYNNLLENHVCVTAEEHANIHKHDFVYWASIGGLIGGIKAYKDRKGFHGATDEQKALWRANIKSNGAKTSKTLKENYASGKMNHWTKNYSREEISKLISQGDPGKSTRGKPAWNKGIKMQLKDKDAANERKSKAALNRKKIACNCCGRLFDAGNLKKHSKSKQVQTK